MVRQLVSRSVRLLGLSLIATLGHVVACSSTDDAAPDPAVVRGTYCHGACAKAADCGVAEDPTLPCFDRCVRDAAASYDKCPTEELAAERCANSGVWSCGPNSMFVIVNACASRALQACLEK